MSMAFTLVMPGSRAGEKPLAERKTIISLDLFFIKFQIITSGLDINVLELSADGIPFSEALIR